MWKREEIISGRWGLPEMSWTVRPWELSDSAISRDSLSGCCPVSGWISWHTIPLSGPMSHGCFLLKAAHSMEEVFSSSDIVSLHIPLNDSTREIVDQRLFDRMKEGAYFINTCRGGVVKEEDLIRALRSGRLRGAGLDVLACEPTGAENPLLTMDNVFITSHMGAESAESGYRSQNIMADTIIRFFKGEMPDNIKNKEVKRNG